MKSKYGRVIDWQYAADSKFAIKELTDKLEVRISPKWCPRKQMTKEQKENDQNDIVRD